jgi:hypothetical protein
MYKPRHLRMRIGRGLKFFWRRRHRSYRDGHCPDITLRAHAGAGTQKELVRYSA